MLGAMCVTFPASCSLIAQVVMDEEVVPGARHLSNRFRDLASSAGPPLAPAPLRLSRRRKWLCADNVGEKTGEYRPEKEKGKRDNGKRYPSFCLA